MSATKEDIRNRVLQKLRILAAGESATAEDAVLVEGVIDALHAELQEEQLTSWTISAVPDQFSEHYAAIVASRLALGGDFEVADKHAERLALGELMGWRTIRRLTSSGWSGDPTEAEYF
jgi:hypothetical protein